jgi:hypothetical protein
MRQRTKCVNGKKKTNNFSNTNRIELLSIDMKISFKFGFDGGLNFEKKKKNYGKFENFQKYHFVNVKNYYPSRSAKNHHFLVHNRDYLLNYNDSYLEQPPPSQTLYYSSIRFG